MCILFTFCWLSSTKCLLDQAYELYGSIFCVCIYFLYLLFPTIIKGLLVSPCVPVGFLLHFRSKISYTAVWLEQEFLVFRPSEWVASLVSIKYPHFFLLLLQRLYSVLFGTSINHTRCLHLPFSLIHFPTLYIPVFNWQGIGLRPAGQISQRTIGLAPQFL